MPSFDSERIRRSIYEKLEYAPEPPDYQSAIPWLIQQQIAATNGLHYLDRVGKLERFPVYELPVPGVTGEKLMLDIGSGWGRWLVAGANKGYIPIGVDIRLEFAKTSMQTLQLHGMKGYCVVGDLENLPFKDDLFHLVWSFSVIQHTHYQRLNNCLAHINRVLRPDGATCLEFPNKQGIRNRFGPVQASAQDKDDLNSWCVRYYSPREYQEIFARHLDGFRSETHSFLGIGVLKEDLKYVSTRNKLQVLASRSLTGLARIVPGMKHLADSLYLHARKRPGNHSPHAVPDCFLKAHRGPWDPLSIVSLLQCPKTGRDLELSSDRTRLVAKEAGYYYRVEDQVPILVASEAGVL